MFHQSRSRSQGAGALTALLTLASVLPARLATAQDNPWESPLDTDTPDTVEQVPADEGDVTESVATGEVMSTAEAPAQLEEEIDADAEPSSRIQVSGFARQSMELVHGELARQNRNPDSSQLWRDVFTSRSQLLVRASYVQERSFEATVSGLFGYTLHVANEAPQYSVGVVDLTRGDVASELREAYLGFFWPSVDLRIGQQRIAWGRSDLQSPNDVLNARDLRDPVLAETELRHVPTFAVRSTFSSGPLTLELVAVPLFVPDRFDVYGSPWSVIQPRAPLPYQQLLGSTSLLVDSTMDRELADLWRQSELPPNNGKGAAAGARLAAAFSGVDLDLYYHYGYDSTPFVALSPGFQNYLFGAETNLAVDVPAQDKLAPVLALLDMGVRPISSRYLRRHHVGLDLATALGPIVARIDAAYQSRRVFYRLDLNGFTSPALLGVFGLEYQTGSLDDVVLLELIGTRLLEDPEGPLLGYERTTVSVAGTLRWTLSDYWGIDVRGAVGIRPQTYVMQPALRFKPNDAFTLKLGALLVSGEQGSLGWYYSDNDTAFAQLLYSF